MQESLQPSGRHPLFSRGQCPLDGLYLQPSPDQAQFDLGAAGGSVMPAQQAGLKSHDVIMAVNDQKIARTGDLRAATTARQAYWKLTIARGGQVFTTVLGG